jgi:hypothetical protein
MKGVIMESKVRIKLGPIEIDYEGSEEFLKTELPNLIKSISELHKTARIPFEEPVQLETGGGQGKFQLTTGSIAAKLACSSGPDLILAAAAHFTISEGKSTFTRQQLLEELRTASHYYKSSYSANLSKYLNGLAKTGKINEPTNGTFALSANTRDELEGRLAN